MTRTSPRRQTGPECYVLNFFHDDDDGCALTTLVRGFRFHIIADAEQLKSTTEEGKAIASEYRSLLSAFRDFVSDEDVSTDGAPKQKRGRDDDGLHGTINSFDSGVATSESQSEEAEDDADRDSAVDVSENKESSKEKAGKETATDENPERALQNWLLAPFAKIFDDLDTSSTGEEKQTLEEWYAGPTYYYNLEIKEDELVSVELESASDLEKRIEDLIPHMHVPKYIKNMDIPWFKAQDLQVLSESDEPDPFHPCRVKARDAVHFLKLVDTTQPQPVIRELKILKDIETKGLNKKFKVPVLTGLVGYKDSTTEILGFLLTDIEDPTPLTKMLDSDVIEEKREKWAMESERIVKILHENNIIWGDAKADNFMVDKNSDLWIIDFGGSYTEGWVDPDLMETKAGDIMGVEKIVNALEEPEENTYLPGEEPEAEQKEDSKTNAENSRKRSRDQEEEEEEEEETAAKKQKP